ncbi:glycoside hydrolase family protein [Caldisericum sp.]|jgi:hypothetical protein|uniref:glycoside hydrolase family protein n=1 Tax=Caldisericum sp. TaxID=2499687 RepID=UPI003D10AB44
MVIGALLGLVGSLIPELVKAYKDWSDKKHELKMLELQIQDEFLQWVWAGGRKLKGLVKRRKEERELFLEGVKLL